MMITMFVIVIAIILLSLFHPDHVNYYHYSNTLSLSLSFFFFFLLLLLLHKLLTFSYYFFLSNSFKLLSLRRRGVRGGARRPFIDLLEVGVQSNIAYFNRRRRHWRLLLGSWAQ